MEDPQAKLIKAGSTIGLPFDQFEPMDLSLCLSITVGSFKCAIHRIIIARDSGCQTAQFRNAALLCFFELASQKGHLPLRDHRAKILDQLVGFRR